MAIYLEGKHPSFRDFLQTGGSILGNALSNWIRQGYSLWVEQSGERYGVRSWRFWMKGPHKGMAAWGILKDSSDSVGRSYPLLILEEGSARGWEDMWDLMPVALNKSWLRMERLAAMSFNASNDLKRQFSALADIRPFSRDCLKKIKGLDRVKLSLANNKSMKDTLRIQLGRNRSFVMLPLGNVLEQVEQSIDEVTAWHMLLRAFTDSIPVMCFAGGFPDAPMLCFLFRAMAGDDFLMLWSGKFMKKDG